MSEHNANGLRQIKLFLVDGSPAGIIMADVVNWTGKVMSAPRARLGQLIRREEAERTGIYLLIGPDPDRINGLKVYVGEADNIRKRLRRHESDEEMDFFDRVAFVVSKDENLTKAHARFLESQIIRLTKEAGTVVLANGTEPEFSLLPEADRSDMAFFIEQLRTVLPILGFDLFRPADRRQASLVGTDEQSPVFELNAVGVRATAREADNGFIVLAGSIARRDGTPTFPRGYQGFGISSSPTASSSKMVSRASIVSPRMFHARAQPRRQPLFWREASMGRRNGWSAERARLTRHGERPI